jgi:tetratricopeptide (TPR) repeat protein
MAYRKLATYQKNLGNLVEAGHNVELAFKYSNRLSDYERHMTRAAYFEFGPRADPHMAIPEFQAIVESDPTNVGAMNNLAFRYLDERDFVKAESLFALAWKIGPVYINVVTGLFATQLSQGKLADAERTIARLDSVFPGHSRLAQHRFELAYARGRFDSIAAVLEAAAAQPGKSPVNPDVLGNLANIRGHLADARRWRDLVWQPERARHDPVGRLGPIVENMMQLAWIVGDHRTPPDVLDRTLAALPLDSVPEIERPYDELVQLYALAGRTREARALLTDFDRSKTLTLDAGQRPKRSRMLGHIALAEGRYKDAIREYRAGDDGRCVVCGLPYMARAYDLSGNLDSATTMLTRYVESTTPFKSEADGIHLTVSIERLAQLWDQKGDRAKAARYYLRFCDLWKSADPELQPRLRHARERLAILGK